MWLEDNIDKVIVSAIRARRRSIGLSQADLARKLGVSHQLVQKQESGESRISAQNLFQISRILGVTTDYMFRTLADGERGMKRPPRPDELIARTRTENLCVLLIDDNSTDQLVFAKAVESCSTETTLLHAGSAQAAEDIFRNGVKSKDPDHVPDLVFLDLRMPKVSGLDFLKNIKKNPNYWQQPIIVMSNAIDAKTMHQAYKSGASGYICKPAEFLELKDLLQKALSYWADVIVMPTRF